MQVFRNCPTLFYIVHLACHDRLTLGCTIECKVATPIPTFFTVATSCQIGSKKHWGTGENSALSPTRRRLMPHECSVPDVHKGRIVLGNVFGEWASGSRQNLPLEYFFPGAHKRSRPYLVFCISQKRKTSSTEATCLGTHPPSSK